MEKCIEEGKEKVWKQCDVNLSSQLDICILATPDPQVVIVIVLQMQEVEWSPGLSQLKLLIGLHEARTSASNITDSRCWRLD